MSSQREREEEWKTSVRGTVDMEKWKDVEDEWKGLGK